RTLGAAPIFCQVINQKPVDAARVRGGKAPRRRATAWSVGPPGLEADDVPHGREPRGLAARPKRRPDRALGKNPTVGGDMDELDALAGAGEDHLVLADHIAAAQGGKSDIARATGADVALTHAHAVILERDRPAGSRGLAEKKGC